MYTKETLSLLKEIREEITRVNQAAGETVFNPALTSALNDLQNSLTEMVHDHFERNESRWTNLPPRMKEQMEQKLAPALGIYDRKVEVTS